MTDDPTAPDPNVAPVPPSSDPVLPDSVPPDSSSADPPSPDTTSPDPVAPGRVGSAAQQVALGAMVFLAALLLLLGATRLLERGGIAAGSSPSGGPVGTASPVASAIPPSSTPPSSSPTPVGSAAPSGSLDPSQSAAPANDPVLVGAGDIGDCGSDGDEATAKLLDGIDGTVFTAGDNAYGSGTPEQFEKCYDPSWGRHLARTRPAPGNHDWETKRLAGYLGYFGDAAQGPDGSSWYSYDLGTWHVIVLDSNCRKVGGCVPDSPQGKWLAADLAASDATCTLAIFHHPRFSSGEHGDQKQVDGFWRTLYAAGADVIVNGHDHDYERFAPQDPNGKLDLKRGIREFVAGTGGTNLRAFQRTRPNSEATLSGGYGVLKFTLHDGSYDVEFIAVGNDFRDRGTGEKCH
jgi:hypothetical protein